jgi:hypothetical protein
MYYGARYYDSYLNRWTQPDTIVPDPLDPQSLNRYSYVLNNPIRYADPSGHGGPVLLLAFVNPVTVATGGAALVTAYWYVWSPDASLHRDQTARAFETLKTDVQELMSPKRDSGDYVGGKYKNQQQQTNNPPQKGYPSEDQTQRIRPAPGSSGGPPVIINSWPLVFLTGARLASDTFCRCTMSMSCEDAIGKHLLGNPANPQKMDPPATTLVPASHPERDPVSSDGDSGWGVPWGAEPPGKGVTWGIPSGKIGREHV